MRAESIQRWMIGLEISYCDLLGALSMPFRVNISQIVFCYQTRWRTFGNHTSYLYLKKRSHLECSGCDYQGIS